MLALSINFTGMGPAADTLPPGTPNTIVRIYVEQTQSSPSPNELTPGTEDVGDAEIVDEGQDDPPERQ